MKLPNAFQQHIDINEVDGLGRTALSWACQRGDLDSVNFLLQNGADPNTPDSIQCTPLAWAARAGKFKCAEALLNYGAFTNAFTTEGWGPLHRIVVRWDDEQFLNLLVRHAADVDALDIRDESPLVLAILFKKAKVAERLILSGASLSIQAKSSHNALSAAVYGNVHSVILLLVQRGMDHTAEIEGEGTLLHIAAAYADLKTLQILSHARLATRDTHARRRDDGLSAMHVARQHKGVGGEWRQAFRILLSSVTADIVFGPEEPWSDGEDSVFEDAVETQD